MSGNATVSHMVSAGVLTRRLGGDVLSKLRWCLCMYSRCDRGCWKDCCGCARMCCREIHKRGVSKDVGSGIGTGRVEYLGPMPSDGTHRARRAVVGFAFTMYCVGMYYLLQCIDSVYPSTNRALLTLRDGMFTVVELWCRRGCQSFIPVTLSSAVLVILHAERGKAGTT